MGLKQLLGCIERSIEICAHIRATPVAEAGVVLLRRRVGKPMIIYVGLVKDKRVKIRLEAEASMSISHGRLAGRGSEANWQKEVA